MAPIDALVRVGLLRDDKASDGYEVADYFNVNKARAEVERNRAASKARAQKAARTRWAKPHVVKVAPPDEPDP